jgi:hypothetical protein
MQIYSHLFRNNRVCDNTKHPLDSLSNERQWRKCTQITCKPYSPGVSKLYVRTVVPLNNNVKHTTLLDF